MTNERDDATGITPEDATDQTEQLELLDDEPITGEKKSAGEEEIEPDADEDGETEDDEEDEEDEDDDDEDEDDEEDDDDLLAEGRAYFITALPAPWAGQDETQEEDDEQVVVGIERPLEEVKAEFDLVFAQAAMLARSAAKRTPRGLEIDEISFSLGFDAGGRIGFIAGNGASGSFEISFAPAEED